MTPKKAIKILSKISTDADRVSDADFEAFLMAMEALERDIPKPVKKQIIGGKYFLNVCPACGLTVHDDRMQREKHNRCRCGQLLDWGVKNE